MILMQNYTNSSAFSTSSHTQSLGPLNLNPCYTMNTTFPKVHNIFHRWQVKQFYKQLYHVQHNLFVIVSPRYLNELRSFSNLSVTSPTTQLILQPFLSSSHNTITLQAYKQLHIQSTYPQLSPVHYKYTHPTRDVVCPSGA